MWMWPQLGQQSVQKAECMPLAKTDMTSSYEHPRISSCQFRPNNWHTDCCSHHSTVNNRLPVPPETDYCQHETVENSTDDDNWYIHHLKSTVAQLTKTSDQANQRNSVIPTSKMCRSFKNIHAKTPKNYAKTVAQIRNCCHTVGAVIHFS